MNRGTPEQALGVTGHHWEGYGYSYMDQYLQIHHRCEDIHIVPLLKATLRIFKFDVEERRRLGRDGCRRQCGVIAASRDASLVARSATCIGDIYGVIWGAAEVTSVSVWGQLLDGLTLERVDGGALGEKYRDCGCNSSEHRMV